MSRAGRNIYDVHEVRKDFPILHQEVNGHPLVYLDNGATSQKPRSVIDAVRHYYERDNANVHRGVHALSERATDGYEGARDTAQRFLNAADRSEIVFVRGTTEGINLVAQSYARPNLREGDEIIISTMEHHSNIVPWQMVCAQTGAELKVIPISDEGALDMDAYHEMLGPKTRIVAVMHVSNALGTVNPVKTIIDSAHAVGAVTLIDGAQATPHLAADVQALDADFYAFSGHKVFGPTGIGVLYGKRALLDSMEPYQGGGEMIRTVSFEGTTYNDLPHKFEAGTPNIAGAIGLGKALDYVTELGIDAISAHEHDVLEAATASIGDIPGVRIIGTAEGKSSIVSFVMEGVHPHDIGTVVDAEGVAIRTGHHCAMPLMKRYGVAATARASFALYNTRDEVEALAAAIWKVKEVFGR
ncbi:MAG: SufS family cysteine desulfurase [Gammaproteobacteria bacterium]|nr:SufS family cysteine desulfurase [Gammaproteobacteria bacterium]NIM73456.1 SufS family cysteine desulfurase [Gammaproteobacteria bacterium]NIN39865.1 SufS family cysteine desulfurase [Gammaproteobacteria bacterium]NIO25265.1 SufS family cysteine desulfurase [Gammaproteobacteria bacterium]NIO65892.1 SufS family cysteine desulfurase [Gammaproteobacteria bacterium]